MAQAATFPSTMTDPTQRRYRGSAKLDEYEVLNQKLGEGTFGVVSKARSKRTGAIVALKKILVHNEKDGFPITALREVKLLKMLSHPNILKLEEMAVERQRDEKSKTGMKRATLYMVTPYMDHDLSGMLTNPDIRFVVPQIKLYMHQLLEGLRYLHESNILHRDMKAANILISNRGVLQIADFGLARHYEGVPPQPGRGNGEAVRDYTSLVVTRWYRPPELLLSIKRYTPAIDMWGVGCVFGEMFECKPILEGKTDVNQAQQIFELVGNPTNEHMPGWQELPGCEGQKEWQEHRGNIDQRFGRVMGPEGLSLLKSLLLLDYRKRINAIDALSHPYFHTEPYMSKPEDLPRYEDSHELDGRRRQHDQQRAPPPAPAGGTVGMGPEDYNGSGPPQYQNGYGYGDRAPRHHGHPRDRGPPGVSAPHGPPRGYDDRRPPPPPSYSGEGVRKPAWQQDRDQGARRPAYVNGDRAPSYPPPRPSDLPPRPDLPARPPTSVPSQAGPPLRGGGNVDSYIPSYSAAKPEERPPPRDYDRPRRGSREQVFRDQERLPPMNYNDTEMPRSRPGTRDGRDPYRERDSYGPRDRDQRRPRSRSPDRDRRERLHNRERDLYRR